MESDSGRSRLSAAALGPEGSGCWLLCLTFLFHEVGRRPLAFPDPGCDRVTPGMKVPEKGHALVIAPFLCWNLLCVYNLCPLK